MGNLDTKHRPLASGLVIDVGRKQGRQPFESVGAGTLTGVARRGSKLLLVTNQHVIAGYLQRDVEGESLAGDNTVRSLDEWQEWSGFDYANRTVKAEWGEWREPERTAAQRIV